MNLEQPLETKGVEATSSKSVPDGMYVTANGLDMTSYKVQGGWKIMIT